MKIIGTAALANQSNIDLELPEIRILLPLLISPINPQQTLLLDYNMMKKWGLTLTLLTS